MSFTSEQRQIQNELTNWERTISDLVSDSYQKLVDLNSQNKDKSGKVPKITLTQKYTCILNAIIDGVLLGLKPRQYWTDDADAIDLIRIFNPINFTWEHVKFIFQSCLTSVGILTTPSDITKFATFVFETLKNSDTVTYVPEPYKGSRYVLFENGIFDAKEKKLIELKVPEKIVEDTDIKIKYIRFNPTLEIDGEDVPLPDVGFTEKHKHHFELDLNAELPHYKNANKDEKDWDPETWLLKTCGNNETQANFLLQIMGVMLVPNHAFNMFIEINGKSNSGKTTLLNIVKSIYSGKKDNDSRIKLNYTLNDLNDTFPFRGGVNHDTVMVHITETNSSRLKPAGISLVDNFANQTMEMKQMGDVSEQLTPPPVLVMEGAGWLKFDSTKTGIARRLLPIDLSNSQTSHYRTTSSKSRTFTRVKLLQWFAKKAMLGYANLTHGDDDYQFQLDNVEELPDFAQKWHTIAVNAGDELMNTFMERITPLLRTGYLPLRLMHSLYQQSVLLDNPEEKYSRHFESFQNAFRMYLKENYIVQDIRKIMRVEDIKELGINFDEISSVMELPEKIKNYENSTYAKYKSPSWIYIQNKDHE